MTKPKDIKENNLEDFIQNNTNGNIDITLREIQKMMDDKSNEIYIATDSTIYHIVEDIQDKTKIYVDQMDAETKEKGKTKKMDKEKKVVGESVAREKSP
jgi:hypothetical protein